MELHHRNGSQDGAAEAQSGKVGQFFLIDSLQSDQTVDSLETHWTLRKLFPQITARTSMLLTKLLGISDKFSVSRARFNEFMASIEWPSKMRIADLLFRAADSDSDGYIGQQKLMLILQQLLGHTPEVEQQFEEQLDIEQFRKLIEPFLDDIYDTEHIWTLGSWDNQKESRHSANKRTRPGRGTDCSIISEEWAERIMYACQGSRSADGETQLNCNTI